MVVVRVNENTEQSYEADQGIIEKDGTLRLYSWLEIGPYKCPAKRTLVATFAPGKWANFYKDN